jgi:hypothetical protein
MRKTVLIVLITFGGRQSVLKNLLIRVDRVDHLWRPIMQTRLFPLTAEPWLYGNDLEELLLAWDAAPKDSDLLARVRAQVGPTDTAREARDQLALHRREWAGRRAAVDVRPATEYPDSPPVVVRGFHEARVNGQESPLKKRTLSGG